jgi:predicted lipoprotein with Yx(FWY)xxD motif
VEEPGGDPDQAATRLWLEDVGLAGVVVVPSPVGRRVRVREDPAGQILRTSPTGRARRGVAQPAVEDPQAMQRAASRLVILAFVAAVAAAACGGGASPSPAAPADPGTPVPTEPAAGVSLGVATDPTAGDFLTGQDGLALYIFTNDTGSTSTCYEECATAWPPLLAPVTAGEGVGGALGTTDRTDGTAQVTYNGAPLYYFQGDAAAGDIKGEGLSDVWFLAKP